MAGEKGAGAVAAPAKTDARSILPVVIEIANDKNRQYMWPMNMVVLRGRWTRAHLIGVTMAPVMASMPDIPGMRVMVDASRSFARVFDPLAEPGNEEVRVRAAKVHKEAFRVEAGPENETRYDNLTADEVKSWLHCMRRAVDGGHAEVVHGSLPTAEQIASLPGRTRTEHFDQSPRARKYLEEDPPEEKQ